MAIETEVTSAPGSATVIGVPFFDGAEPAVGGLPVPSAEAMERRGFTGKAGQAGSFEVGDRWVVCLGLGAKEKVNLDGLRRAAAVFVKAAATAPDAEVALAAVSVDGSSLAGRSQAVAEGLVLGNYRFDEHKSKEDDRKLGKVAVIAGDDDGAKRGTAIGKAVRRARDLVNQPPSFMTPRNLAAAAQEILGPTPVTVDIWDEKKIEAEGLGGLRGVSLGSSQPPRLIRMAYEPANPTATIALVGKGITFDSGGLSLKPGEGMMTMKTDMAGAAAVITAMSVMPVIQPTVKVIGIAAVTENLPGPSATKPGDVLKARNGKTMEVLNTDAEGRLVLADALSLAVEDEPAAIIDLATLTGACTVALGAEIAGLMGNHDGWSEQVSGAAARAAEDVWTLPLPDRYRKHIDSDVADIKNIGAPRGAAGTLTAGLFLKEFVAEVPWVHLDIAGPSRADGDDAYVTKGATGFGVRTLVELVDGFCAP